VILIKAPWSRLHHGGNVGNVGQALEMLQGVDEGLWPSQHSPNSAGSPTSSTEPSTEQQPLSPSTVTSSDQSSGTTVLWPPPLALSPGSAFGSSISPSSPPTSGLATDGRGREFRNYSAALARRLKHVHTKANELVATCHASVGIGVKDHNNTLHLIGNMTVKEMSALLSPLDGATASWSARVSARR